jgi:hypothetical protein
LVAKDHDLGLTVSRLTRRGESKDDPEDHIEEGKQHRRILGNVRRRMNRVLTPLTIIAPDVQAPKPVAGSLLLQARLGTWMTKLENCPR